MVLLTPYSGVEVVDVDVEPQVQPEAIDETIISGPMAGPSKRNNMFAFCFNWLNNSKQK